YLPEESADRTFVFGAGKAAAAMARAVETHWNGPLSGLVVTRYGHGTECRRIEIMEAGHPVPDDVGVEAAERMLETGRGLDAGDQVLALISGGGSSLLSLPASGITLADKQAVVRALLRSGAPISAINTVRRHLSAIKGGALAMAALPARTTTYVISDVPGDDPAQVASGPTLPDRSTPADAREVLLQYSIDAPDSVWELLAAPERAVLDQASLANNPCLTIARAADALEAA